VKARLLAQDEKGGRALLGEKEFLDTEKRDVIMEVLIQEFWDPRLDSASCRPVVDISEPE
jgi:hypothetical protein